MLVTPNSCYLFFIVTDSLHFLHFPYLFFRCLFISILIDIVYKDLHVSGFSVVLSAVWSTFKAFIHHCVRVLPSYTGCRCLLFSGELLISDSPAFPTGCIRQSQLPFCLNSDWQLLDGLHTHTYPRSLPRAPIWVHPSSTLPC